VYILAQGNASKKFSNQDADLRALASSHRAAFINFACSARCCLVFPFHRRFAIDTASGALRFIVPPPAEMRIGPEGDSDAQSGIVSHLRRDRERLWTWWDSTAILAQRQGRHLAGWESGDRPALRMSTR